MARPRPSPAAPDKGRDPPEGESIVQATRNRNWTLDHEYSPDCGCVLCEPDRPRGPMVCDVGASGLQPPCGWCENCRRAAGSGPLAALRLNRAWVLAGNARALAQIHAQRKVARGTATPVDAAVARGSLQIPCRHCTASRSGWKPECDERNEIDELELRDRWATRLRELRTLMAVECNPMALSGPPGPGVAPTPDAWRTDTVVAIVAQMRATRDYSVMPILADALQDAGCDDPIVLAHCRRPGSHGCTCWVIRQLLGR